MNAISLPYPISTNRMWRHSGNVTHLSTEGKKWKLDAHHQAINQREGKLSGDVAVLLVLHPRSNKDGSASKTVLDLANAEKCTIDAMQGVLFDDDKQIKMMMMRYGEPKVGGGVTLFATTLENHLVLVNYLIHKEV